MPQRSPSLGEFRSFVRLQPSRLAVWDQPGDPLDLLLRSIELWHAGSLRSAAIPELVPRLSRALQDAEGILVRWASERARSPGRHSGGRLTKRQLKAVRDAIRLALEWSPLETALVCAENGLQGFDSKDWVVRFPREDEDIRFEALDRTIGRNVALTPDLSWIREEMAVLRPWIQRQRPGQDWAMSDDEFRSARRMARLLRSQSPREFDADTRLPGFTLAQGHAMWDALYADAYVSSLLTVAYQDLWSAILAPKRSHLVERLAAQVQDEAAASAFVETLTFRAGYHPDPALAPLIESGERFLVPPGLVLGSAFERNLLRTIALNPALGGHIGDVRGRKGVDQVVALMATMSNVLVEKNLPVVAHGNRTVGDLDVVAVDAATGEGVIIEVKWPAPTDHIIEILRVESMAHAAQVQAERVRSELESGAGRVRGWPAAWPTFDRVDWTWYVLIKDHIPYSREARRHRVQPISWELLWSQCQDTLGATVRKLASDDFLPEEGVDYERVWHEVRVGPYRIEIENFELYRDSADPRDLSRILERVDGASAAGSGSPPG